MTHCRFCKNEIADGATRCPFCTSILDGSDEKPQKGKVTYIIDEGLISFSKFALAILAIFITVGVYFYGFDLKNMSKEIADSHEKSRQIDQNMKHLLSEIEKDKSELDNSKTIIAAKQKELEVNIDLAKKASADANAAASQIREYLSKAKEGSLYIQHMRTEVSLLIPGKGAKSGGAKIELAPQGMQASQIDRLIEAKLLTTLSGLIAADKYNELKDRISASGLRRIVYDAKGSSDMSKRVLARSESDPASPDDTVNKIYDNIGETYRFYNDVFSYSLPDKQGSAIIAVVHYNKDFNNAFWDGRQLFFGDGDGELFERGSFSQLSVVAAELSHAVAQYVANLSDEGESGALNRSFGGIFACLVEQWSRKQTVDDASWLVGENIFAKGIKGALLSLKAPGTAYDHPVIGKDRQVSHMKYFMRPKANGLAEDTFINNGIPNKAFYELAVRLKGYAWEKPGKIWFSAYQKLSSKASFKDLANATLSSAAEIYGDKSDEWEAVKSSWAAVGIGVSPKSTR